MRNWQQMASLVIDNALYDQHAQHFMSDPLLSLFNVTPAEQIVPRI